MSANENFADSNRSRLAFVKELVFGTTPDTPTMQTLRMVSSDLAVTKNTSTSDEIRPDRQVSDVTPLDLSSGGNINFELSILSFDDFIAAALGTEFVSGGNIEESVSWTIDTPEAGQVTFTAAALSGLVVEPNQWVFVNPGTTETRGFYKVVSHDGTNLIVRDPIGKITTDGSGTVRFSAKNSKNGVTKMSFSIEQAFLDASAFQLFRGQRVGSWSLSVEAGARITGAFGFSGLEMVKKTTEYGTTYNPATDTPGVNATSNVGYVLVNGQVLASTCLQSWNMELDNGLREQRGIGNAYPCGIGLGRQVITGSLTAYFADFTLYDLFLNHSDVSVVVPIFDNDGNGMLIEVPLVKFTSDPIAPSGIDTDVIDEIEWSAVYDPTDDSSIRVAVHNQTGGVATVLAQNLLPEGE